MSFQVKLPRAVEVNPTRFYRLADMAKSLDESTKAALEVFVEAESNASQELEKDLRELASANTRMEAHIRQTTRTNAFDPTKPEDFDDRYGKIKHSVSGNSFLGVIFSVMDYINEAQKLVLDTARGVRPAPILIVGNMLNAVPSTVEELQLLSMQMEMNDGAINSFVNGVLMAELTANVVVAASREIVSILDGYYSALVKRHSTDGVQIHGDPVTTDLAISIFENIDLNGEIQDGRKPDEVSAFSVRKAITIIEAIQNSMIGDFIKNPASLINQIQSHLRRLWKSAETLAKVAKPLAENCRQILGSGAPRSYVMTAHEFNMAVNFLSDLDPTNISYKDKTGLLSVEERREMEFQNETLKGIVDLLAAGQAPNAIVQYVLARKAELRAYHLEENSFYVCRIGTGNPFTGDAPGQLSVVPGIKPTVKLDEVVGSGFDEVKTFISNVTSGAKWFDLFVATSPSKKADKSNVLLVGPQGCGKCVTGDTMVFTDTGLAPISSWTTEVDSDGYAPLNVGVLSLDGMTESSHFYDSGVQPTIRLRSRHGYQVEGTAKHRVVVASDEGPVWKRLDEVSPGDYIGIVREQLPFGAEEMPEEKAYVLGYWVGDGSTTGSKESPQYLRYAVGAEDLASFQENALPGISAYLGNPRTYPDRKNFDVQVFGMSRADVAKFLLECGKGADNKRVPREVLRSGRKAWKGFLSGIFDADGGFASQRIELGLNSFEAVRVVQLMLTAFGIVSMLQKRGTGKGWRLFLYGDNARKFHSEIGFRIERKSKAMQDFLQKNPCSNYDVVPLTKSKWKTLKEVAGPLTKETHRHIWPYASGKAFPSRGKLKQLLSEMGGIKDAAVEAMQDTKYFWDKVLDCAPTGEARPVYDLVVPGAESFAANGLMNHNTEVLRAVASDRQSIGIFAQASDFLTCWKGEAEKNPKRLFEEGLRLQKESKKQVFFLIDEIDTILNGDRGQAAFGGTNLATEFQVLMDGITSYPHLALWGATNHPERIPMPLIRRFAKVVIVGELDQADRIKLLKQFTSFLPISEEFPEEAWENAATKLDGAVGDIMRKVVDGVWREKMGTFVSKNPDEAEKLVNWLNDGAKFAVSTFNAHRRVEFKNRLRSHVQVSPKDLHDSIDQHLRNVAIRGEIETAKETYERARNFLSEVNAR